MLKKSLFISLVLTLLSIVAVSCCTDEYTFGNFYVTLAHEDDGEPTFDTAIDTVDRAFTYDVAILYGVLAYNPLAVFSPNKLMALTCEEKYLNPLVESSYRVFFDKDIEVNGNTYSAGFNLLQLEEEFTEEDLLIAAGFYRVYIAFKAGFLAKSILPNGPMIITFEAEQQDGTIQSTSISFVLDLT